jgi:hypothetical protein
MSAETVERVTALSAAVNGALTAALEAEPLWVSAGVSELA